MAGDGRLRSVIIKDDARRKNANIIIIIIVFPQNEGFFFGERKQLER